MDDEVEFLDIESEKVGAKIDFSLILLRQLDRILKALSFGYESEFIQSVKALEVLLTPYRDKRYFEEFNVVIMKFKLKEEKIRPDDNKALILMDLEYEKAIEIYGLLMGLINRKAFIPTTHHEDRI